MKRVKIILAIISAFFILALVIFPDRYIYSVQTGLNLFAVCVLPALFPFFFFSKILTYLDVGTAIGKGMGKPMLKLYGVPPSAGYIFVLSILSGYPIGAKLVSDSFDYGFITKDEAKTISTFCSTSGPLFILGTVGISMFKNKGAGYIILAAHFLSAFLNGLLYRRKASKQTASTNEPPKVKMPANLLGESMTDSISSVMLVGGYIAVFSMFADVLADIKIIDFFASALSFFNFPVQLSKGLITSLIEMTRGCQALSKSGLSMKFTVPAAAFAVTFGGLSVTLQSMTFLSKCGISPSFYLKSKLTQAIIALAVALPLALVFHI